MKQNANNLLIEIGTEELPLSALNVIYSDLAEKAKKVFSEARIEIGEIKCEATPRRIAFFVESISGKQTDEMLEIQGPKWEASFDGDQKPTKALQGFLKSKGATLKDVTERETSKGKFVLVKKLEKGKSLKSVLPELLTEIFTTLPFPKMMKWDASGFRFPRPIRWIVALVGDKAVSFQLSDVKSGRISYGHRFLSPKSFSVKKADWKQYQTDLKKKHVVLSLEARKEFVRKALKTHFKQKNIDEDLLHTAVQLTEEPFMLEGSFDKSYLKLPPEVLALCMKKNQKIFACYGPGGKLQNKFVAVLNGKRNGLPRIRFDYENVLDSRLKDARYFFQADTQEPLEAKRSSLEQITYLGKLGTMLDKSKRLEFFSEKFAELNQQSGEASDLARVSVLAKNDLMTQMVFEFPELQGIVGRDYASASGEPMKVALAIGSQYQPASLSESYKTLPKKMGKLGALFGVMDRLDLLVGAYGTGIEPTGSQDPFALRRAGGSMVKIIRAFNLRFSFLKAIDEIVSLYGNVLDSNPKEKLLQFLGDRVAFELQLKSGSREHEIFQAVWNASNDNLGDVFERFDVLVKLSSKDPEKLRQAAKVVERTGNISKQLDQKLLDIKSDLFNEPLEKKLFELIESKSKAIESSVDEKQYEAATKLFGETFYMPVHDFFEQVMVNVEDTAIRANRQALMQRINRLYTSKIADLSVLSRLDEK